MLKKKNQWYLLKHHKEDFIQEGGTIMIRIETTVTWFCSEGEREWAQLWIQRKQVVIYSQGAESLDGKFLREKIRNGGVGVLVKQILAKDRPGWSHITWGFGKDEEPD